jgi:ceramide glucosyltransferase
VPVSGWLSLLALLLCAAGLFYSLVSSWYTWRFFQNPDKASGSENDYPPVSVLKPVFKDTPELLENLASFCNQDYPEYEVVFASANPKDPGVGAVQHLLAQYPPSKARMVFAPDNSGPNYKIGNLLAALKEARYELIVISDADMRVDEGYLKTVVRTLEQKKAGLVTCLYRTSGVRSVAGALEAMFVQGDFIPGVVMAQKLEGLSFAFGSTLALARETLSRAGGLEGLKFYLADDYHLGNRIRKLGLTVEIPPYLMEHRSGIRKFRDSWRHQLRWAVTIRVSRPFGHFASILTHSISLSILNLVVQNFSVMGWSVFSAVLLARLSAFYLVNRLAVGNAEINRYLWLLPLKDVLGTVIWGVSFLTDRVFWGGRTYKVKADGTFVEQK